MKLKYIAAIIIIFVCEIATLCSIVIAQDTPPMPPAFEKLPPPNSNAAQINVDSDPHWIYPKGQDRSIISTQQWYILHTAIVTNSSIHYKKPRIKAYRKECPECGAMLTSTNFTTQLVVDEEKGNMRITTVTFACPTCDETYTEVIRKRFKKTPVMEVRDE